jgi:DNA-directed RNA polymerase specialized sigma24 family protein
VSDQQFPPGSARFPTTHWSQLQAAGGPTTPERRAVLNGLITRYWKPVYLFICRSGYANQAADLTQEFFLHALERELFGKADRARGRFRTFLLACLKNFLVDAHRRRQRAGPPDGIVSIGELATDKRGLIEPVEGETPEDLYNRAWVMELFCRVWQLLQDEFAAGGQGAHTELFRRRVYEPILGMSEPPEMRELAAEFGIPEKQACNFLVTARRAFQRLLRAEIRWYAASDEEVAEEIAELFRLAARPGGNVFGQTPRRPRGEST